MTEKRLHELVGLWKHRLGLDLWDIQVVIEAWDDPHYADLQRSVSYDRAVLRVQPWMLKPGKPPREDMLQMPVTDEFVETALVHELLHAVHRDYVAVIQDDLEGYLHRDTQQMLEMAYKRIDEQTTERLAVSLVRAWKEEH